MGAEGDELQPVAAHLDLAGFAKLGLLLIDELDLAADHPKRVFHAEEIERLRRLADAGDELRLGNPDDLAERRPDPFGEPQLERVGIDPDQHIGFALSVAPTGPDADRQLPAIPLLDVFRRGDTELPAPADRRGLAAGLDRDQIVIAKLVKDLAEAESVQHRSVLKWRNQPKSILRSGLAPGRGP